MRLFPMAVALSSIGTYSGSSMQWMSCRQLLGIITSSCDDKGQSEGIEATHILRTISSPERCLSRHSQGSHLLCGHQKTRNLRAGDTR